MVRSGSKGKWGGQLGLARDTRGTGSTPAPAPQHAPPVCVRVGWVAGRWCRGTGLQQSS
jgi:hypothetical protein